jgi:hypothetical protein
MPTPEKTGPAKEPPRPAIADEESLVATLTIEELQHLLATAKTPEQQDKLADSLSG